ncbi:EAL domain-containing protein [Marinobacter sp.]|uniref:EAL domain-containing protein n=1 Tax=Marinobacter sp. TaxID=50741 RepID=UPI0019A23576|nr:EAL domain-containing protein [Marinobacter sp.]MBD3658156.1 EAL domain-containing protein [Marinobacter sp.]
MDAISSPLDPLTEAAPRSSWQHRLGIWSPLLLVLLAVSWGLGINLYLATTGASINEPKTTLASTTTGLIPRQTDFRIMALDDVIATRAWTTADWQPTPEHRSGLGFLDAPATFRFTLDNPADTPRRQLIVVAAPFLDHIAPAVIAADGSVTRLAVMGDRYPFSQRFYDLPHWIWPVTLPPRSSSMFLFEVRTSGSTLLPVAIAEGHSVPGTVTYTLVWKSFIAGILAFALVFNLIIVSMLKRPGLAWISVLLLGVIHSQLVMEGFGLWLLWPQWPVLNALINISLPLTLIALCQFTPHFIDLARPPARMLQLFSVLALLLMLTTPFNLPFLGQGSLLVLAIVAGGFILAVVARQLRSHVYARYYALSILAIFLGGLAASLRTVGLLPVNGLTDSAFFLGTAISSVILTVGVGRQLLEERRRRLGASIRARHEQQLRSRIEKDYDRLLTTHRVTGIPNRAIMEETLQGRHDNDEPYALAIVRLQRFNEIEQALGYRAAEDLLRIYLRRLNSFLKMYFGDRLVLFKGHALASIDAGTHGFAVRTASDGLADNPAELSTQWQELIQWLGANFVEGRYTFSWQPSIGVARAPDHGRSAADIISSAGFASLSTQQAFTVYDPAVAEEQYRQQVLMLDLESALGNNEIRVHYQPKVAIREQRVVACEALLRWHHPEFGLVSPASWIPLAEQVGTIHAVTRWVVNQACQDWAALRDRHGETIAIAVNISALDLKQPRFDQEITAILAHHAVPPRQMILEITETAVMSDIDQARRMIHRLNKAGFRIALDDFGTGHSSLSALASFALDELKIDRSFLEDIIANPVRQRIFRAALELGEALDLDVVVEGVDDHAVATWLQQFPGLFGQGYYWSRPESIQPPGKVQQPPIPGN